MVTAVDDDDDATIIVSVVIVAMTILVVVHTSSIPEPSIASNSESSTKITRNIFCHQSSTNYHYSLSVE